STRDAGNAPRTGKRRRSVERHARLTSFVRKLESLADEVEDGWMTKDELWSLLLAHDLTGEWGSAAAVYQSLYMVDCPARTRVQENADVAMTYTRTEYAFDRRSAS